MAKLTILVALLVSLSFLGCVSMGPWTVARDRFDYAAAISESWKSQTLLNLVKIRYADAPVFLDVASIINQYALTAQLGFGLGWFSLPPGDSQTVTGTGAYAERPTITYSPLTGAKFTRSMMTPIPPAALFSLMQANWPIPFLFRLCVKAINGIYNRTASQLVARAADPDFYALLEAMQRIQQAGALGLRVEGAKGEIVTVVLGRLGDAAIEVDRQFIRKTLGLNPDATEFQLAFGALAKNDQEIAVLTRSMLEILAELASNIEVPAADVAEQWVLPTPAADVEAGAYATPLLQVHSGGARPAYAFVAVPYHNSWFWIDGRDFPSKRTFSLIMILFTLVEPATKEEAPIVTIPIG
jgi:hypothetical protein